MATHDEKNKEMFFIFSVFLIIVHRKCNDLKTTALKHIYEVALDYVTVMVV